MCGHEAQLEEEIVEVAVASAAADQGLPVVVQGFDAADRWAMFGEGEDRLTVAEQRIVQATEGLVTPSLCAAPDPVEALRHHFARLTAQYVSQLLFDLVAPREDAVVGEQAIEPLPLGPGEALVPLEEEPARAATDSTHLFAGSEEQCFIEIGGGKAGFGAGDFYAEPKPLLTVRAPSRRLHLGKVLFEKLWLYTKL